MEIIINARFKKSFWGWGVRWYWKRAIISFCFQVEQQSSNFFTIFKSNSYNDGDGDNNDDDNNDEDLKKKKKKKKEEKKKKDK